MRMRKHWATTARATVLVAASVLILGLVSAAQGDTPPPPGWTAADWNALPPEKQQSELLAYPPAGSDQAKAAAVNLPAYGATTPETLQDAASEGPGASYSSGILNAVQSPLDANVYTVSNSWSDLTSSGTQLLSVYAGAAVASSTGFLMVRQLPWPAPPEDDSEAVLNKYDYSYGAGPLTITSGSTSTIVFTDGDSRGGSFNLSTRTYACPSWASCGPPPPP
jgi:hypothetical protein